ncbi:uncharacterized protein [Diabrotica undecimpunctata]|uniref:uncharacterized protein n=1 Tax=Diabrotica undecimpunctata TaxID=50387 RepID=UPI003B63C8ED
MDVKQEVFEGSIRRPKKEKEADIVESNVLTGIKREAPPFLNISSIADYADNNDIYQINSEIDLGLIKIERSEGELAKEEQIHKEVTLVNIVIKEEFEKNNHTYQENLLSTSIDHEELKIETEQTDHPVTKVNIEIKEFETNDKIYQENLLSASIDPQELKIETEQTDHPGFKQEENIMETVKGLMIPVINHHM